MNIPSFPQFLAAAMSAEQDEEPPALPMREAQINDLRQILARPDAPQFRRGDIVRWGENLGCLESFANEGLVLIFWGYLGDITPEWRAVLFENATRDEQAVLPDVDCVIASLRLGSLVFDLAWSPFLDLTGETVNA